MHAILVIGGIQGLHSTIMTCSFTVGMGNCLKEAKFPYAMFQDQGESTALKLIKSHQKIVA